MNNFKKPYSSRTNASRPGVPRTGSARPSYGAARPRTTSPRDARTYRSVRSEGSGSGTFQKFDAVCSNCGKKCQVPFRPDGTKPVYCKDCFDAPRGAMPNKKKFSANAVPSFSAPASTSAAGGKSIADLTRQIAAMNAKIDTMLKILQEATVEEE